MNKQEQLMDNLLNIDLEIIDCVRSLQESNWDSGNLKQQVGDLLKIRDNMLEKLILLKDTKPGGCTEKT
ncbi:MAG: hypothetical protein ITD33_05890 [Nitrosarchaeum sp.]|nr:hypothetical protein [Nitrosarchaeum sp.]MBP0120367.1 hypothetical protein [Nitrosarchaeum sp.]MBP0133360.1 hypothetical protein [Nitrosarchaeum sp.]MDW7641455.1 hypothetical protein [Nitrosarchaeum sp.]MSV26171.1 hypothetical protein [Nitrosarchaeum sp.]